jgi:hypothetical protein
VVGNFLGHVISFLPPGDVYQILLLDNPAVQFPQEVFDQNFDRIGKFFYIGDTLLFQ